MKFMWSVAWRNLWRHKRRSLITAFAMATGVALCMAMITLSDGMYRDMFEVMVEQQLGHVQVHHPHYPSKRLVYDALGGRTALLAQLDGLEGTVASSPVISGYALIGGPKKSAGGQIVGIDPARDRRVSPLAKRVIEGAYLDDVANHQILLGHQLAEELGAGIGDEVVAVTQATDGSMGNGLYIVAGLFKTGDVAMDKGGAYVHIADAEELLVLFDQAHGITLITDHSDSVAGFSEAVRAAVGGESVEVQAWWEASPQTAELMSFRDAATYFMLSIVFGVAAFGVINTMLMSVFERTREMGVLRALGLRPGRLVRLVVLESFLLAAVAAGIGLLFGGFFDWYLVTQGLDFSSGAPDGFSFEGVMLDPIMYGEVRAFGVIATVSAVFLVSVLASLWPAWRAARLNPVTAIRSE